MKSIEDMMKAAQEAAATVQAQMEEAQAKLDAVEVEGVSGGGLVKIRASAKGRIKAIAIDDSLMVPARSEEHTSELQSLMRISYAVFCLKKKNKSKRNTRE